jgi:cell division septum initiation protein DivIVA
MISPKFFYGKSLAFKLQQDASMLSFEEQDEYLDDISEEIEELQEEIQEITNILQDMGAEYEI